MDSDTLISLLEAAAALIAACVLVGPLGNKVSWAPEAGGVAFMLVLYFLADASMSTKPGLIKHGVHHVSFCRTHIVCMDH